MKKDGKNERKMGAFSPHKTKKEKEKKKGGTSD